jgi:hypothetical protein
MNKFEAIVYFTNNYGYINIERYESILEILNLQEPIEKEYIDKLIKRCFDIFQNEY